MDTAERISRMEALRHREREEDVTHWIKKVLHLPNPTARTSSPAPDHCVGSSIHSKVLSRLTIDASHPLMLLLDYDGTLSPLVSKPADAILSAPMRTCLQHLLDLRNVTVAIVSGRNLSELMVLLDEPRFIVSGNHGLEIMFASTDSHPGELFEHSDVQVVISITLRFHLPLLSIYYTCIRN
jgi:hypothetical protein